MVSPQDTYKELGQAIRRFRKGAGRTQAQLASEIGISRASLANIEAGRQQILVHYLYAIADALDLNSPSQLMPMPQASTPHDVELPELQLPKEGLSEKQRQEVLRLMGGVLNNRNQDHT